MLLAKPDSKIAGVQIGAITYSFRSIPDAEAIIKAYVTIGLSEAELMSNHAEQLAGAPPAPPGPPGGRGRGEMTPEQQAEAQKAAAGARGRDAQVAFVDLDGQVQGCPQEVQ